MPTRITGKRKVRRKKGDEKVRSVRPHSQSKDDEKDIRKGERKWKRSRERGSSARANKTRERKKDERNKITKKRNDDSETARRKILRAPAYANDRNQTTAQRGLTSLVLAWKKKHKSRTITGAQGFEKQKTKCTVCWTLTKHTPH